MSASSRQPSPCSATADGVQPASWRSLSRACSGIRLSSQYIELARCGYAYGSAGLPPRHEGQALEQMHVLLVLEQRAVQRRYELFRIALAQRLRADVLDQQQFQPVQQLGGRGLLLEPRHLADLVEQLHRLRDQPLLDAGKMHLDDRPHGLAIGKADVMEEAAAQERVRQLLLVVRGDDDDRPAPRLDGLAGLVAEELHAVELQQQIVGELDVRLVDLVDQQDRAELAGERLPQTALDDVVADVVHAR